MDTDELIAQCIANLQRDGPAALERFCAEHPELEDEARRRLSHLESLGLLVPRPDRVGPYELITEIGHGGMGVVYRGRQTEPVAREVAVKLVKAGMDTREVLARFAFERQTLARLDHRYVARLLDAGTTPDGRPYFVMELVSGEAITSYCDRHALGVEDRLALMMRVCEGVEHAHQRGVLHRDLKPSNILVRAGDDGTPEPRIIDFGIARLVEPSAEAMATARTHPGAAVGTPEYMAPEQTGGDPARVDTRSDVYALGVILYEVLTGTLPFEPGRLRRATPEERRRILEDEDVPRPSARARADGVVSGPRATDVRFAPALDAELDWITLKCLSKDPRDRYAGARDLASDLRRHLDGMPVAAGPPTTAYRLRKFLRRHRGRVAAVGLLLVTLILGAVGTMVGFLQARSTATRLQRKVDEFELLSIVVDVDRAAERATALGPAGPDSIPELTSWLDVEWARLERAIPRLATAIADIQGRAAPEAASQPDAEGSAVSAELARAESLLEGYRRLRVAPSDGLAAAPSPSDDDAEGDANARTTNIQQTIDRGFTWRPHPDSPRYLALARSALAKVDGGDTSVARSVVLNAVAWSALACGRTEEAREAIDRAVSGETDPDTLVFLRGMSELIAYQSDGLSRRGLGRTIDGLETRVDRLRRKVVQQAPRVFATPADQFLHDKLAEALQKILALEEATLVEIRDRLEWSRAVAALTVRDHAERWRDARNAIAAADGHSASDRYRREPPIDVTPRVGLVPIGKNPTTGLWEFYDLRSAWDPRVAAPDRPLPIPSHRADGSIEVGRSSGIVFVLLPGGIFRMGAQRKDRDAPQFDPAAETDDGPVHEVTLAPFFIARHELTRGQWSRLTGGVDPSTHRIGQALRNVRQPITFAHPVETVDWNDANRVLHNAGLTLPTEAQWEFACRAGTDTPWSTGDKPASLEGFANLADATARSSHPGWPAYESFTDGYVTAAPVGTFRPNPFGLFDVHGNLFEWCRGTNEPYSTPPGPGDGLRWRDGQEIAVRGGCWNIGASGVRSADRSNGGAALKGPQIGMRAALPLLPPDRP